MKLLRRFWKWLHIMATPAESARYARIDRELEERGL